MILHVPNVLNGEQVARCREVMSRTTWEDGRVTAGHHSALVKNNSNFPRRARSLGSWVI